MFTHKIQSDTTILFPNIATQSRPVWDVAEISQNHFPWAHTTAVVTRSHRALLISRWPAVNWRWEERADSQHQTRGHQILLLYILLILGEKYCNIISGDVIFSVMEVCRLSPLCSKTFNQTYINCSRTPQTPQTHPPSLASRHSLCAADGKTKGREPLK